jgi:ribosome small subunit-dependent GTPase A
VDRTLIAAYAGGLTPILCLTKTDLAPPEPFAQQFVDLDLTVVAAGRDDPLLAVADMLAGKITVLLGHSGVGKSTLVNRLVPDADRAVGDVTDIGRGRHTSTQSVALPLTEPLGTTGWVIDTPGIRSFGLAHIQPDDVIMAFSDLAEAIADCPRGCGHMGPPADPECALDTLTGPASSPRPGGYWPRSTRLRSQSHAELVGRNQMALRTTNFHARLGAAAQVGQPQPVAAGQVTPSPLEHRPHHRHEFDSGLGEHVFVATALPGLPIGLAS